MIAASVGKKQIGKTLMLIVAVIVLVLVAVYVVGRVKGTGTDDAALIPGGSVEDREQYLSSIGLQVDATSSVAEVGVPEEFDERFTQYNEMLKLTGFDLEPLQGKTVKKCTYTVTNRPELGASVSVVLLVYDDQIVAGHMLDNATNTLYPLFDSVPPVAEETILPSEQPVVDEAEGVQQGEQDAPPEEIPTDAFPSD
jgi:hypothetical protein